VEQLAATRQPASAEADSVVADAVVKQFENGVVALEDVSLRIAKGEFISIVGPSGCGKSTFLRLVAGLTPATSGAVAVNGHPVTEPRADVGLMFQKPTLLPWKTALENVLISQRLAKRDRDESEAEAERLLELVGLSGFEHTYPAHLSGGMQQRVALARLLIMGVDVLLLDEPFAAVDELTRERLNREFLEIHARIGATVIFVTHSIAEATFLADRLFVMSPRPGRLAATFDVELPRPRTLEHLRSSEFQERTYAVRQVLERFEWEAGGDPDAVR
jgi:NitT/TauT family transport system ATP-binding protein